MKNGLYKRFSLERAGLGLNFEGKKRDSSSEMGKIN